MISFIIIGKNEGWKLTKCFQSVHETIKQNCLQKFEIIYVDSNSTDDSVERAKTFKNIRIFKITGVCNAAIARNIGAKESNGDCLFFIDGDMEIQSNFLSLVYSEREGLKYSFVSGNWINYNYNNLGLLISKDCYTEEKYHDKYQTTVGGLFLIKKDLWVKVDGMKSNMKVNEDLDFGLRLCLYNIRLLRKKELLAIHHTIPYNDFRRMWSMLFRGLHLYRIVLLRNNITNIFAWKYFLRGNYTFIVLLFSIIISFVVSNPIFLLLYLFSIAARCLHRENKNLKILGSDVLITFLYEISFFFGFFIFWPECHSLKYVEVN